MGTYNIVDTGQTQFYGLTNTVSTRQKDRPFTAKMPTMWVYSLRTKTMAMAQYLI